MDPIKKLEYFEQKLNEIEEKIDENNVTQDVFLSFLDIRQDIDHLDTPLTTEKEKEFYHNVKNRTVSVAEKMPFKFEALPEELQLFVTSMLAPKDLVEMSKVSQSMKGLAEDTAIWKKQVLSNPVMRETIEKSGGQPEGVTWKEFYRDFNPTQKKIELFFDLIRLIPRLESTPIDEEALKGVINSEKGKKFISEEQKEKLFKPSSDIDRNLCQLAKATLESLEKEEDYFDQMLQFLVGPELIDQAYKIKDALEFDAYYDDSEGILSNNLKDVSDKNVVRGTDSAGRKFFAAKTKIEHRGESEITYIIIGERFSDKNELVVNHFSFDRGWIVNHLKSLRLENLRTLFSTGEVVTDITERRPEGTKTTLFKS